MKTKLSIARENNRLIANATIDAIKLPDIIKNQPDFILIIAAAFNLFDSHNDLNSERTIMYNFEN